MRHTSKCPECSREIVALGWAHDLCPGCLMAAGVESEPGDRPGENLGREPEPAVVGSPDSEIVAQALEPDVSVTAGRFRILRELGKGGMGIVYLAEQERPIRRRVALKIIKPGMDTSQVLARFESERQALAIMDHPHIAKVHDAGSTDDGRPYFVMEYIEGVPLTEYCDRHRLTTDERLRLFMRVCDGVQHAHQKAVIHRDLKPSNILVTTQDKEPVPKIIDFGVAKAIEHRLSEKTVFTELGQIVGTLEYMSPEQAAMTGHDVDTRSDVYSLGLVLYELLVGALPYDPKEFRKAGLDESRRRIREDEPSRPSARLGTLGDASTESARRRRTDLSTLRRQLRNDLDWICLKALEKDRRRRYESPSHLAADILRHLNHEPVSASSPGTLYRVRKFAVRHRIAVGVAASTLVLLLTFAAMMTVQANRIAVERDRANREADTAKQVSGFLVDLFEVSDPSETLGDTLTAREILDHGAERISTKLDGQPLIQARLMNTLGVVYQKLGIYDVSGQLLESSCALRRQHLGDRHLEVAESLNDLGKLMNYTGNEEAAVPFYRESLEIREELLGPNHPDVATTLSNLAATYSGLGRYDDAESAFKRSLEIKERALGPFHLSTAKTLHNLGIMY